MNNSSGNLDYSADSLDELNVATDTALRLVGLTSEFFPSDTRSLAEAQSLLAESLRLRGLLTGEREDITRAVHAAHEAVRLTDTSDSAWYERQFALTEARATLWYLYEEYQTYLTLLGDLETLLTVFAQQGNSTRWEALPPALAVDFSASMVHLVAYYSREAYELFGYTEVLEQALACARQAAAEWADGPMRPAALLNLARTTHWEYYRTGDTALLESAISGMSLVLGSPHLTAEHRWIAQVEYAKLMADRYAERGREEDARTAVELFQKASEDVERKPYDRAEAALGLARAHSATENWTEAVEAYDQAIHLLSLAVGRGMRRRVQESRLVRFQGLGQEAAAVCIELGLLERAVDLLERTRGILLGQALDLRTDVTDLAREHPTLAKEFEQLQFHLQAPGRYDGEVAWFGGQTEALGIVSGRRAAAGLQLDEFLGRVRLLPGFEGFLVPPTIVDVQPGLGDLVVVLVNVAPLRCDALIVSSARVQHVPLEGLDFNEAEKLASSVPVAVAEAMNFARPRARSGAERQLSDTLDWAWRMIAEPVLKALGLTARPSGSAEWPVLHWCLTGALAFLPIHAAYRRPGAADEVMRPFEDSVWNRVVSSYTPTIRSLSRTAGRQTRVGPGDIGRGARDALSVLVVAMPDAVAADDRGHGRTRYGPLPEAAVEAAFIEKCLPSSCTVLGLPNTPQATWESVFGELSKHSWVHFACHAESDPDDPAESHLVLSDHERRPLTVGELSRLDLDADLASLGACSTASVTPRLPDEPFHLAAACQLAGFRRVVGTLWPVYDSDARMVTEHLFSRLVPPPGTPSPSRRRAAASAAVIREVTERLAQAIPDQPSRWAAHMHFGP